MPSQGFGTQPTSVFSGEPMPLAPFVNNPELGKFHSDLLEYLRRLGSKLDSNLVGGPSGVESLVMYYNDDFTIGTSFETLDWPTIAHRDPLYDVNGGFITPKEDGLYFLDFTLDITNQDNTNLISTRIDYKQDGASVGTLIYGDTQNKTRTHHASMTIPITKELTVSIEASAAKGGVVGAAGTRLTIYRIAPSIFLGQSGGNHSGGRNLGNTDSSTEVTGIYVHKK